MSDPSAATATQVRNIEAKTGKSLAELAAMIAASGLTKVSEQRSHLMQTLGLGYGDANAVAILAKQAASAPAAAVDPLDALYSGKKAPLRVLHLQQVALLREWRGVLASGDQASADAMLPDMLISINAIASGLRTTG